MADSVRLDIHQELMTRLATITTDNGYNHNVGRYYSQPDAEKATDTVALWVTFGPEEMGDPKHLGGGQPCVVTLQIHGYVRKRTTANLVTALEQAIQDVRNAVNGNYANWKSNAGAAFIGFDTCETDEGILAYDGLGFFTQPLLFTYNAGPTW